MALKRALVVDDSRSARVALQKQLKTHNLSVEMAESAEDALDFLQSHWVDVVFMDHEMPGMNGLEAVKAIKSNPQTAMIPVMMYTSKGGELYVSQARALGAVDLLPKQTEPGVLFNMLLKLGLVTDRRKDGRALRDDEPAAEAVSADTKDIQREEQPIGMELSGLLTRILEDQHIELRYELQKGLRSFATQVASELHENQQARQDALPPDTGNSIGWPLVTGALAVALLTLALLFMQIRTERDVAREDLMALSTSADLERQSSIVREAQLTSSINEERSQSESAFVEILDALAWSMNQSGTVPYGEPHLNDFRADQLRELLWQLSNAQFSGSVRVESHLGEFCLIIDSTGAYRLAEPDAPMSACAFLGHPLDNSNLLSDRQTPDFERFLTESPLIEGSGIELELIARQRVDSVPRVPYPVEPVSAGEWNSIAVQNNRVEFSILEFD